MNKWVEQKGVENPKPLSHVSHKKEKIHKFKKIFFLGGGEGKTLKVEALADFLELNSARWGR